MEEDNPSRDYEAYIEGTGLGAERRRLSMNIIKDAAETGVSAREVFETLGLEDNDIRPHLSNMHKAGIIVRLKERRNNNGVYVLPEHVNGRPTVPHRPHPGPGGK